MKRIDTLASTAEVDLARSVLESAGIPCVVRNESLAQLVVGTPFQAELWVEDAQWEEARLLLKDGFSQGS